ncbi:hypothetical protein X963_6165 [Burkholderia pseudomallei MSHR7498]|nr:hypothetical protein X990_6157 [Burkholderia pseudomallei MSHR4868]KGS96609.1 hypothetical protein X963_6165 [Burkholderia pseudomallei MSHR7498]CAJ6441773.1 Uncharacterised protein [Burkholderia pseudomallei]CAJ7186113.1 Uncharacterised protein [Burkholderia pseudomallei]
MSAKSGLISIDVKSFWRFFDSATSSSVGSICAYSAIFPFSGPSSISAAFSAITSPYAPNGLFADSGAQPLMCSTFTRAPYSFGS